MIDDGLLLIGEGAGHGNTDCITKGTLAVAFNR